MSTEAPDLHAQLEEVNEKYWDALDYLAEVTAQRAAILNLLKPRESQE